MYWCCGNCFLCISITSKQPSWQILLSLPMLKKELYQSVCAIYIFWILPLISFEHIFSHSVGCLFHGFLCHTNAFKLNHVEENGNPLQYSAQQAAVHGAAKESDVT